MTDLVGRTAMFNPIFNGEIHYTNGTELTPCKKNIQVRDGTIQGTIIQDRHYEVLITGPVEPNGWSPVYLMSKQFITLLPDGLQFPEDQINN